MSKHSDAPNLGGLTLPESPVEGCYNVEIEQQLLGAMLTKPELFIKLNNLRADHFYDEFHQEIYSQGLAIATDGKTVSPILLGEKLGQKQYLMSLVAVSIHVINPEDYADEVSSMYASRKLIFAILDAKSELSEGKVPSEVGAALSGQINTVLENRIGNTIRDDYDITEEIIEDMTKDVRPISTGMVRLDKCMGGGFHPGMSYGFAGRKKMGKTILASTISYNLNEAGVHHLFIACEMGSKQIHQRNIARGCDIYASTFRNKEYQTPEVMQRIKEFQSNSNQCIHYMDAPGLTFDGLKQAVSMAMYKHKISGFILDYWQLVGGKPKNKSTSEHLDEVAQWIADFCRKHGLWSMVMGQINQDGNTRGGEGMRLAFDQVYQIHRPDVSMPGAWLEMMDTRYTTWNNLGSKDEPGLEIAEKSPYFIEKTPTYYSGF